MLMLPIVLTTAAGLCGAVLHRCAGGFIGTGNTQVSRLLWWVVPTAVLVTVLYEAASGVLSLILLLSVATAVYLGRLVPHGWTQNRGWTQYAGMAGVGAARFTLLALACAPFFDPWPLLPLCGMLSGLAYAIGYELIGDREFIVWHPKNPYADDGSGYDHFAKTGGEWSEVLTGLFYWMSIATYMLLLL